MTAALPAAVTVPPSQGVFGFHPRTTLERWPGNPRQTFDEQALAELARSMAGHGMIEPIIARAHPSKKGKLEIAAGERRWRASELAKMETVPVIVRELNDKQMLELATIENAQREDLHPLEQADGYERLIKEFGYTPEKIADGIGKSRAHVFQIRKLRALAPSMRKAFLDNEMDTTLATVVARVPSAQMQEQAWKALKDQFRDGFSFRIAADFIRKNYMLDLGRAPFNITDATLVAKAGACGVCPKRTGNQADLFPDVRNGNVCADPSCFNEKRAAAQAKEIKTLEAKGTGVIVGAQAKRLMPYGSYVEHGSGYRMANERCYDDPKQRTWGQLAKAADAAPLMIQNPHTGNLEPIVKESEVKKALEAKGVKLFRTHESSRSENAWRARQKAQEEKDRLESEARRLAWLAIRAKVGKLEARELAAIAIRFWNDVWHEHLKRICAAWEWPNDSRDIDRRIAKLKPAELARLLMDLALAPEVKRLNDKPHQLLALGPRYGVRLDKIRATVLKEARLKKAAKAAAAKAKARKAPGKVKVKKGGRK